MWSSTFPDLCEAAGYVALGRHRRCHALTGWGLDSEADRLFHITFRRSQILESLDSDRAAGDGRRNPRRSPRREPDRHLPPPRAGPCPGGSPRVEQPIPECFVHLCLLGVCWRQSIEARRNLCEARWSKPSEATRSSLPVSHNRPLHISRVLRRHTPDQATDFGFRRGTSDEPATRLPGPELPEPLTVPAHHRIGLDDHQDLLPAWPETAEREPEDPIGGPHPRSRSFGREDGELLAKGEVLDQKVAPRRCEASEPAQDDGNSGKHRDRMEGWGSDVNDAPRLDSRYDPLRRNRSFLMRMEFWRGTAARAGTEQPVDARGLGEGHASATGGGKVGRESATSR